MRQSDILLFFDRAFAHGSDGSQLYICFEKIYNGTDLQLMHMAADDHHEAHLPLSFIEPYIYIYIYIYICIYTCMYMYGSASLLYMVLLSFSQSSCTAAY